ncbi:extracellular solute-binding protein, partial [Candidatus Uhrbacteria bacterium]|nr:extracellular solute-binding protein [Candidatus Uhrbacteria bacterium]
MSKRRLGKLVTSLLVLSVFVGQGCTRAPDAATAAASKRTELNMWAVIDDEDAYQDIIRDYRALHPNVSINFRRLRLEEYESELLNALAEDRGPDIVSIHNSWMGAYLPKLAPLPATLTIPFQEISGTISKETVVRLKTSPTLSKSALRSQFVDAVAADALIRSAAESGVREDIYGLPLALDTLALFANRDLLNLAGIPEVPKTWSELQSAVKKLTKFDQGGQLTQSGAALGASRNVERASDILTLLMMQNGTEMLDQNGSAAFHKALAFSAERGRAPGPDALIF